MRDIGINSLKFFTGDGKEILMKKQYSVCWEIIPADPVYSAFIKNPTGHIELYPSNNLNNMFSNIPDSNGYIKTSKIEIKNNMTYIVTLSSFERTSIRFYTSSNVEETIENFKKSDLEHGYKVSNNNGIYEIQFNSDLGYKYFAVYALESDSYHSVKENSNKANVIVDDSGQIRNHVEFYLKDGEEQYLYDSFAIARTGKSEDILSRIYPTETYYTLNSLCEILFFTYKTVYTSVYTTDNKVREVYESRHSDYISNKVLITVFDGEDYAQSEYNILDIFRPNQLSLINTYYGFKPVVSYDDSSRNNLDFTTVDLITKNPQDTQTNNSIYEIDADSELFTQVPAINSDMDETLDSTDSFIKKQSSLCYMMSFNIPESQFPYVKYIGQCYMDKVSVGFVQPETIIIYDDSSTPHNEYGYPEIKDPLTNESFRLHFRFQKDSEMSFLTTSDNMHIDKKDNMFMLLYSEKEYPEEAMHMTVGFQSDSEGVFQNVMGIFIRNIETNQDFIIGAI